MAVMVNRAMQTKFRESDTQTRPWTPPYVVISAEFPEVLTLTELKWGEGLPAGKPEVEIVERVRKKAAWERFLATVHPAELVHLRKRIVQHIELDEWRFKERQLMRVHKWRMELAEKQMEEHRDHFREKTSQLLHSRSELWEAVKQETVKKIRNRLKKDLQRLNILEDKNYHQIYRRRSIIDDLGRANSEFIVPLARRGYQKKHMSLKMCKEAKTPVNAHKVTVPRKNFVLKSKAADIRKHDCVKENFQNISPSEMESYNNYLKKLWGVPETKEKARGPQNYSLDTRTNAISVDYDDENEYAKYLSSVLLQKVLKGRAVQAVMQEGRWKNQGLIEDLLSTGILTQEDHKLEEKQRQTVLDSFRRYCKHKARMDRLLATIAYLQGNTITLIIKFASRELLRLQDEQTLLELAMVGQAERWQREAWEAGIRQKEQRRHRQRAEIYRQFVETIDKDLEEGMRASLHEALYSKGVLVAENIARSRFYKVEAAANKINRSAELQQQEEMVSSLMSQVVLPETQREEARSKLSSKQDLLRSMAKVSMYGKESWRGSNMEGIRSQAEELVDAVLAMAQELLEVIGRCDHWDLQEHLENTGFDLASFPTLRVASLASSSTGKASSQLRSLTHLPDFSYPETSPPVSEIGSEDRNHLSEPSETRFRPDDPVSHMYRAGSVGEICHCSDIKLIAAQEESYSLARFHRAGPVKKQSVQEETPVSLPPEEQPSTSVVSGKQDQTVASKPNRIEAIGSLAKELVDEVLATAHQLLQLIPQTKL